MTTKVTVDENLRGQLDCLLDPAELCDEFGRTLGHFLPEDVYRKWLYASIEIPFSDKEIERRRSETGGRSLAEIWMDMGRT